ncbi:RhuM family protein [Roseibium sp. RKSG952]|uniref:RhuM family protein n=1 Tax=Roseibium sp. RKSG952 TaxID=2529384 RepID=UPI0012BCD5A9|nr:RhuM family protein [Roseibium sp. RKSG952]MTH94811.1 hypothetical protein [Roseibium sp. RKSG952]
MSELIIFQNDGEKSNVEVLLEGETVWLTVQKMADLFDTTRQNVQLHLKNIFLDNELDEGATCKDFLRVRMEGKREVSRKVPHYNLDAIISVGYRVNSKKGVRFRQWSTKVLNDHLVKGYTINQRRLADLGLTEAQQTMELLSKTLHRQEDISDESRQVLDLVSNYASTWTTLLKYDEDALGIPEGTPSTKSVSYDEMISDIGQLKQELLNKGEATDLFGREREHAFDGLLGNIDQTMFGESLYKSAEEKAANLFYFVIKDHPFSDGNKRIASFSLLRYMQSQKLPLKITPEGLTAMALLVAASEPSNKDLMIRLVMNSITSENALRPTDEQTNGTPREPEGSRFSDMLTKGAGTQEVKGRLQTRISDELSGRPENRQPEDDLNSDSTPKPR